MKFKTMFKKRVNLQPHLKSFKNIVNFGQYCSSLLLLHYHCNFCDFFQSSRIFELNSNNFQLLFQALVWNDDLDSAIVCFNRYQT